MLFTCVLRGAFPPAVRALEQQRRADSRPVRTNSDLNRPVALGALHGGLLVALVALTDELDGPLGPAAATLPLD